MVVLPFPQRHNVHGIDATTAIVRNPNKCVNCNTPEEYRLALSLRQAEASANSQR